VTGALARESQNGPLQQETPGPTQLSMSFSPQQHCMSSQLHQRGSRFEPTPCSMPDKSDALQAVIAAGISAYSGHRGEHGKAQGEAFTTTFTAPLSPAESLSSKAVCHLSMFTSKLHASTPRSQFHRALGLIVCPPDGLYL
jgi:hypothetical protein